MKPTVIYDQGCPYCVTIARIVNLSSKFEIISYESQEAKEILEEEFEDPGFTFYLIEEEKIYFGNRAAQRIAEKLYRSKIAGKFFLKTYPYLSKLFSILSRRTNLSQPECTDEKCLINTKDGGIVERKTLSVFDG